MFKKWQQGDDAAFDILFRKYYKPLCYVAGIKTGDVHQAEDIVQELFTDILKSNNVAVKMLDAVSTPIIQIVIIIACAISVALIVFNLLKQRWSYFASGIFGITLSVFMIILLLFAKAFIFVFFGLPYSILLIVFSFLTFQKAQLTLTNRKE